MSTDAEQSSRERFEAWASRSKYPLSRWPHEQDTYVHPALNCAWQAWHARDAEIAEQAAEIARLREAISILSLALEASLRWSYEETREIASGEKSLDNTFSDKYVNDIELIRSGLSVTKRGLR